eukprot:CAMPEP_0196746314 /NCGR_PEP_ID=MMETSP1091-20130531/65307_1 /TAXON_ID=302021 /ORGANISM="Rhodomonas sp., Strain CCMP768" /LENGTH=112 /DNA_ID=CAMNT_0042093259 /DNA_START=366 /DNA_END=700 /DNA_ORIENTATION=+
MMAGAAKPRPTPPLAVANTAAALSGDRSPHNASGARWEGPGGLSIPPELLPRGHISLADDILPADVRSYNGGVGPPASRGSKAARTGASPPVTWEPHAMLAQVQGGSEVGGG